MGDRNRNTAPAADAQSHCAASIESARTRAPSPERPGQHLAARGPGSTTHVGDLISKSTRSITGTFGNTAQLMTVMNRDALQLTVTAKLQGNARLLRNVPGNTTTVMGACPLSCRPKSETDTCGRDAGRS